MRWVYTAPEHKEFVSDGHKIYSYFPADRQVMVTARRPAPTTTPALFLTGKGDISRDFERRLAPSPVAGAIGLKLRPERPEPNVDYFIVATAAAADRGAGRPGPPGRRPPSPSRT